MSVVYDPRLSDFDIKNKLGTQAEIWVADFCEMLSSGSASIEVKRDAKVMMTARIYIEYECFHRDNVWRKSGIAITKADIWIIKFGGHEGALIISTEWLRRAARLAWRNKRKRVSHDRGQNPTRGVCIDIADIMAARDISLDEP